MSAPEDWRNRPFLQPLAVALVSIVLVLLFFAMAAMGIRRVEQTLLAVMEGRGKNIIEGVIGISRDKFEHVLAIESQVSATALDLSGLEAGFSVQESLAWNLINLGREIDRQVNIGGLTTEKLKKWAAVEHIGAIAILDGNGQVLLQSQAISASLLARAKPLFDGSRELIVNLFEAGDKGFSGLIGLRRKAGEGVVLLAFSENGLRFWGAKTAIQEAVEEAGWRQGVRYFGVSDKQGHVIASAGDTSWESSAAKYSTAGLAADSSRKVVSRRIQEKALSVFEVAVPFRMTGAISGIARVGLETESVDQVLAENRKFIFLSMGFMLAIGLFAMWLLYKTQNRHLVRTQEMREKLHQAERLSSLGQLAAGVAHEIRNPLNAISMATQRLQRGYRDNQAGRTKSDFLQLFGIIRDEIRRLNGIVEEFLNLSRKTSLILRPQSVSGLLERILTLVGEEANSRSIKIHTSWKCPADTVRMDADKMQQAFFNLIKNAFESISGNGTLSISTNCDGIDRLRITVKDSGTGITPAELNEIFSPEYTTKEKGLGLGLPIAHEIIRAHGGEVRIQSIPGQGTVFEILLPLAHNRQKGPLL